MQRMLSYIRKAIDDYNMLNHNVDKEQLKIWRSSYGT